MLRLLICFAVVSLWPLMAAAQGSMPGYTIVDLGPLNLDRGQRVERDPETVFGNIKNNRMKSVLELQNQITMINALTNWQTQITKLEETYLRAGLPFTPPPPPRHICEQVPPNTVCSEAYSDMAAADAAPPPVVEAEKEAEAEKASVTYEWADIRCMAQDCRATIVDAASGMRMTGTEGESVAEGVIVQSITPTGVRVTIDGVTTDLRASDEPAQSAAVMAKPEPAATLPVAQNELQALLNGTPGGAQAAAQAATQGVMPPQGAAMPAGDQQPIVLDDGSGGAGASAQPGAPLGPTGLF